MALWRVRSQGITRWAAGPAAAGPSALLPAGLSLDHLLAEGADLREASELAGDAMPAEIQILAPIEGQEVWAAGVTYMRSREARKLESKLPDHYDNVYEADRPELFLKATPGRVRGPGEKVGIRRDSGWDVPEPELGLVTNARGDIVAYVIGNDMSSRSIEGENPLYLPQAKTYEGSCALGPCLVPLGEAPAPAEMVIRLGIERDGTVVYGDQVGVDRMHRTLEDLVAYLYRALAFPIGAVLLTGTGIVPPSTFTLEVGDRVVISISGLGTLQNLVEAVG